MALTDDGGDQSATMVLEGRRGFFHMSIMGYQFPAITDEEWDSDWLVVAGRVSLTRGDWRFRDSCITTFEMVHLADWLEAVSLGIAGPGWCALTEPNLQFDGPKNGAIRVSFALECAPPWARRGEDWNKHGFEVPIGPSLALAADQLRRALVQFPRRGGVAINGA
jgi:hypothetical protein